MYPLCIHINLVAHQDLVDIIRCVLLYVANPISNVYKLIKKKTINKVTSIFIFYQQMGMHMHVAYC